MKVRQKVFLIVFIAVFSMAIAGATYAFLQPGWRRFSDGFDVGAASGGTGTFTAYSNGNIEMKVQDAWMAENLVSGAAMVEDNASVTIEMDGGTSSETWTCTYDLIWVWDSEDKFTEPDVPLPYTHTDGKVYPYEFSIKVGDDPEKDLSSFTWNNNRTILQTRTLSVEKNEHSEMTIPIVTKMYNIPVIQNKFSDKLYKGHVIVSEPSCTQTPTILAVAETKTFLADAIKKMYTKDGEGGLYYHDGKGDYTNASYEATDSTYRYSGANPNNYLCFGSEEEVCPEDNLYRIIYTNSSGTKVVKNSSIGNYKWNDSASNDYESSSLLSYLNNDWLNSLGDYADLINNSSWSNLGSGINDINVLAKDILNSQTGTLSKKIVLKRVFEYGLAASPENWNKTLANYNGAEKNWLYNPGESEWTITRSSSNNQSVYSISETGTIRISDATTQLAVKPVFMLKNTVFYMGGNGTKADPIRIDNNSITAHILDKYNKGEETAIYYHSSSLANSATDSSYRYSGTDPNNYVCFDGMDCADSNNLYRIIGIFGNQTKLIKAFPSDYRKWSSTNNTFAGSDIDNYLNGEYLTLLGDKANLLADTTWYVGDLSSYDSTKTSKNVYDLEKTSTTTVSRKVGLMYPSEYGFAALPAHWATPLYSYGSNAKNDDWIYLNISKYQWTIGRKDSYLISMGSNGYMYSGSGVSNTYAVRPSFSLKTTVRYISGDGSYDNPYVIG